MLNSNQLKAIENVYQPTLVIAGPGTGKTELLAARIGKIVEKTGDKAGNILCLTYSRAGVKAMKDRLAKKFSPEFSEQVHIHTFHSFCAQVIKDKPEYFNSKAKSLIDDIKLYDFLYPLVTNPTAAGINYSEKPPTEYLLKSFKDIMRILKEEKLDNTQEVAKANQEISKLRFTKQSRTQMEDLEKIEKFRDALLLIEQLEPQLQNAGLFDFNDMLYWVIEFFQNNPEQLLDYRENFLYVLVDEFQDTNPLQLTLLNLLILKNGDTHPPFFAVGDDDQCIYRFQGASVETIINLTEQLPTIEKVVLTENYRSTQDILDMAGNLISQNQNRVVSKIKGLTKDLIASKKDNIGVTTTPRIWHCLSKKQEAKLILSDIKHQIDSGNAIPSDFAILYRNRSHGEELVDLIKKSGLPYTSKDDNKNLMDMDFVLDLDNALQLIRLESYKSGTADGYLFKIILNNKDKYDVLEAIELMDILKQRNNSKRSFIENLQHFGESDSYSKLFNDLKVLVQKLIRLTGFVNDVMTQSHWSFMLDALQVERTDSQIWKDWDRFFENEIVYRKDATILDWSELFAKYRNYKKPIDSTKEFSKEGIKLLTLHGAKGLEFKHVYIIGCSNNKWEKPDKNKSTIKFPKYHIQISDSELEDKRRLIYVGITRAEKSITFSYYKDGFGRYGTYELSQFVKQAVPNSEKIEQSITSNPIVPKMQNDFSSVLGNHLPMVMNKIQNDFRFSPSTFKDFISCSSKFLLSDILRMPGTNNEAMAFGTAVHNMIELLINNGYHKNTIAQSNSFIELNWPIVMDQSKHFFIRANRTQYEIYGKKMIQLYYENFMHNCISPVAPLQEENLTGTVGNAKIKGKIDRIDISTNHLLVVDYKTGTNATEKWNIFKDEDNIGGDHWKQAWFYLILVSQNYPDIKNMEVEFHYVEKEEKKSLQNGTDIVEWIKYFEMNWSDLQELKLNNACRDASCLYCKNLLS